MDVHYHGDQATAAGVLFAEWTSDSPLLQLRLNLSGALPYEPGSFFKRELPFLLQLLDKVRNSFNMVLIDGYVWLGSKKPGLGRHLYLALGGNIPVIGVAKSKFKRTDQALPIVRGSSKKPLYVTAAGMDQTIAAEYVKAMHGHYRIPTMLKLVDRICRSRTSDSMLQDIQ